MTAEFGSYVPSRNGGKIAVCVLAFLLGGVSGSGGDRIIYEPWEQSRCRAENPILSPSVSMEDILSVQEAGLRMAGPHPPHMILAETALSPVVLLTHTGKPEKTLQIQIPVDDVHTLSAATIEQAAVAGMFIAGSSGNRQLQVLNPVGIESKDPVHELPRVVITTIC